MSADSTLPRRSAFEARMYRRCPGTVTTNCRTGTSPINFCNWFPFRVMGEDNTAELDKAKSKLDVLFGSGAAKPARRHGFILL